MHHTIFLIVIERIDAIHAMIGRETDFRFLDIEEEHTDENGKKSESIVNTKGVYALKGEQVEFKKIDVKFEGSNYVLSKTHDNDKSYLALYDNILIEGVEADEE